MSSHRDKTIKNVQPSRDMSQLHSENRKLIAKSGGAAIGFYPDNGAGQKGSSIWFKLNIELLNIFNPKQVSYNLVNMSRSLL